MARLAVLPGECRRRHRPRPHPARRRHGPARVPRHARGDHGGRRPRRRDRGGPELRRLRECRRDLYPRALRGGIGHQGTDRRGHRRRPPAGAALPGVPRRGERLDGTPPARPANARRLLHGDGWTRSGLLGARRRQDRDGARRVRLPSPFGARAPHRGGLPQERIRVLGEGMGRHLRREATAALLLAGRPRHSGNVDRAQAQRAITRQRRMQPVHVQLRVALGLREGAAFHHPRPDPARLRRGTPGEGHRRQARGSRARGGRRRQVRDRPYGNAHPEHLPGHLQPAAHPVPR